MLYRCRKLLLISLLLALLAACGGDIKILEPKEKSIHAGPPAMIRMEFAKEIEEIPKTTLNNQDITHLFELDGQQAIAIGSQLASFISEGTNLISVDAEKPVERRFVVNTEAPLISVLSAKQNGSGTEIVGRVIDWAELDRLTVNGLQVSDFRPDGTFFVRVHPQNGLYNFDIRNKVGLRNTVAFRSPGQLFDRALRARVNSTGLRFLSNQLVPVINNLDLNALVAGEVIYEQKGPLGNTIFKGTLRSLTLRTDTVKLNPTNDGLNVDVTLKDARVSLDLCNLWCAINIKPTMRVNTIKIDSLAKLSATNGATNIDITQFDVDLQGISFDRALGVFDSITFGLISAIVNRFEGAIGNAIKGRIVGVLNEQIADLIPTNYSFDVTNKTFEAKFRLEELNTNGQSLLIGLSGGVLLSTPNNNIPNTLIPLHATGNPPVPQFASDFGLAVNTNVINQTLFTIYRSGLTHLMLSMEDGKVYPDLPRNASIGGNGSFRLLMDPESQPFIKLGSKAGVQSSTLHFPSLNFTLQRKTNNQWITHFSVEVDVAAAIKIGVNTDNTLAVEFLSDPRITIKRAQIGTGQTIPINAIQTTLQSEISGLLGEITSILSAIQLPALAGYSFKADSFHGIGSQDSHAGLTGKLVVAPASN